MPKRRKQNDKAYNCVFPKAPTESQEEHSLDVSSQYNVRSKQSIERISHILSCKISGSSSIKGASIETNDTCRKAKQPRIQILINSLIQIFRLKKPRNLLNSKKNKVLIYHVPKQLKSSSVKDLVPDDNKVEKVEKPVMIRDQRTHPYIRISSITRPPNKLCGPGEILSILKLKESGRVRHVGVSNLNEEQITRLSAVAKPACLQIECHALCQQTPMLAFTKRYGIPVVAYSPLGSKALADSLAANTGREYPDLLNLPAVKRIAATHSRTPAQVLLRHLLQLGVAAIPKSTDPTRIKQNISVWDFELNDKEMAELADLDRGEDGRICDFSFFQGVKNHPEFPFRK